MITEHEEKEIRVLTMRYRQPIINRLDNQTRKGIEKYGNTIDRAGHLRNGIERLEYLAEELTDGLVYIEDYMEYVRQLEEHQSKLVEAMRWIRDYQRDYGESLVEALNQVKCHAGDTLKELGIK